MNIQSLIVDNFFELPMSVREKIVALPFCDVKNPFDGVTYPNISAELPSDLQTEIVKKLARIAGVKIMPKAIFARLSLLGQEAPHQAHTDTVMAQYTALIYMTLPEECQGGTSIVEHVTGMRVTPRTPEESEIWRSDTNLPDKWRIVGGAEMRFNRLFLVNSDLYHRAEPIGGFGKTVHDGRLVIGCFFNLED